MQEHTGKRQLCHVPVSDVRIPLHLHALLAQIIDLDDVRLDLLFNVGDAGLFGQVSHLLEQPVLRVGRVMRAGGLVIVLRMAAYKESVIRNTTIACTYLGEW